MSSIDKPFFNPWDTPNVIVEEYAIGGKLLTARIEIPTITAIQHWDNEQWRIEQRNRLVNLLSNKILTEKLCEITTHEDVVTGNKIIYARCYLAPHDQVKIIRSIKR